MAAAGHTDVFVKVVGGRGLKSVSLMGKQDPYCVVRMGGTKYQTSVHSKGGSTPKWDKAFVYSLEKLDEMRVQLELYHKGIMDDTLIGMAEVPLAPLLADSASSWVPIFNHGKPAGDVELEVNRTPGGAAASSAAPAASAPPAPAVTPVPAGAGAGAGAATAPAAGASAIPAGKTPAPDVPEVLDGKYTDLKVLGAGNFGVVFRARSMVDDEIYAVKMIKCPTAEDLEAIKREAKILFPLVHTNVLRYFSSFLHTDKDGIVHYCLVTEFCAGGDLNDVVEKAAAAKTRVNDGLIGFWVFQIADALAYLHAQGIIHRDLKGDNCLLRDHNAKISDFGLATVSASTAGLAGAYAYESPEQVRGLVYDGKTDVWSLGCMITEMVTLKMVTERSTTGPFALNPTALHAAVTETAALHPYLGSLAGRLLAVEPAMRPTAQQVVAELHPQVPSLKARAGLGPPAAAAAAPRGAPMFHPGAAPAGMMPHPGAAPHPGLAPHPGMAPHPAMAVAPRGAPGARPPPPPFGAHHR